MKIIYLTFVMLLTATTLFAQDWQELKGEHFVVYFIQDKAFARKVLHRAEKNYERIASDLGYARYSNFWTWSNRVRVYICLDHASYLKESGQPEWSEGMADYGNKKIVSYLGSDKFLDSVLPHEIAHLIFRDFVGFKGEVPLWLDEGVAQWEEELKRDWINNTARQYLKKETLLSLKDMMKLDIRLVKGTDSIHLHTTSIDGHRGFMILDGKNLVNLYYLQAASLVGFLIERYGADKFTEFCRQLRDGAMIEDALGSTYSTHLLNIEDLERRWIEYLKQE